jgi:hypothetical protein
VDLAAILLQPSKSTSPVGSTVDSLKNLRSIRETQRKAVRIVRVVNIARIVGSAIDRDRPRRDTENFTVLKSRQLLGSSLWHAHDVAFFFRRSIV